MCKTRRSVFTSFALPAPACSRTSPSWSSGLRSRQRQRQYRLRRIPLSKPDPMASVLSSLRYLLADFIGEDDGVPPFLPEGLPDAVVPIVSEGIHLLMEYQGSSYAQLYVDRVRRFVGQRELDERMLGEIARLMALRMSYQDPIRIAQLKLMEFEAAVHGQRNATDDLLGIFRVDELIGALPAAIAEPVLDVLERLGWTHAPVSIRFSSKSGWGVRRLKIESSLRRWRLFS